jgi:hypothetical protein
LRCWQVGIRRGAWWIPSECVSRALVHECIDEGCGYLQRGLSHRHARRINYWCSIAVRARDRSSPTFHLWFQRARVCAEVVRACAWISRCACAWISREQLHCHSDLHLIVSSRVCSWPTAASRCSRWLAPCKLCMASLRPAWPNMHCEQVLFSVRIAGDHGHEEPQGRASAHFSLTSPAHHPLHIRTQRTNVHTRAMAKGMRHGQSRRSARAVDGVSGETCCRRDCARCDHNSCRLPRHERRP